MHPTPYPDLNAVLHELVLRIEEVLGTEFVGAYLQGSFAIGDFDEHSDVDWIVAVVSPLREDQIAALQDVHARVYDGDCPWAQHLEGSYFPHDVLRTCARRGERLWYLDNGSRALIRADHCNTSVVRQVVREHGIALAGPPAATLVDSIPIHLLRSEILATMCEWGKAILSDPDAWRNRFYRGFIALSYCRMWSDLVLGSIGSKRRGAEWAKARLDSSWTALIDRAWATRPVPEVSVRTPADPDDFERTLELVRHIIQQVRGC